MLCCLEMVLTGPLCSVVMHLCRMQISALLCCLIRFAFLPSPSSALPFPFPSGVGWGHGCQYESFWWCGSLMQWRYNSVFFAVFSLLENRLWDCLRQLITGLDLMGVVIAGVQRVTITNLNKTHNLHFWWWNRERLFEHEVFLLVSKKDLW